MATSTQNHVVRAKDRRRVRMIAKIRDFTDSESTDSRNESVKQWISVHKPKGDESESVIITLREQALSSRKEAYEVDFCYEQNEMNDVIFEREVSPLIPGVFDGHNATVIACGARGSGKTYTIQGREEEPGLALQAMNKIISIARELGKSVAISCYEIFKEHVFDLLNPRLEEVSLLNDGRGKIQLKGLSRVPVTTLSEFQRLYACVYTPHKVAMKQQRELQRSHKGLIVHVFSSLGEKLNGILVGKMNFVDLAGYEDARRKTGDGYNFGESAKINKSMYGLKNVVHSLNTNGTYVPYRESVLTRMLQDSLEGTSKILIATCLNPSPCLDSMYMLSLFSRSCQATNSSILDLTKKSNSLAQAVVLPSPNGRGSGSSSAVKKHSVSQTKFSVKTAKCTTPVPKARKLFNEESKLKAEKPIMQESSSSVASITDSSLEEVAKLTSGDVSQETVAVVEEDLSLLSLHAANSVCQVVQEASPLSVDSGNLETTTYELSTDVLHSVEKHEKGTPITTLQAVTQEDEKDQENNSSLINKSGSPPISARLQELSNSLKLLCSSTPSCLEMTPKNETTIQFQKSTDLVEPRTPVAVANKVASFCSPWEAYSARSVGVKNSLVQEYLKFLNTAGKEELKKLKGIGEKRANYILELREESPEPFKDLGDLKEIGLSAKQVKKMMKMEIGGLFE